MNRNNSDNNTEAVKIANALKPFAKKWFDEWGQSCVRSKKMTVSTPPNGSVIGVKDAFSDTEVFIKYMSSCSNAVVGDTVWCKWMYDNMQTLYADEIGNLRQPTTVFDNSSSGNYAKVVTFSTNVTTGKNLAPVNAWNTGRRWWGSNINSSGLLGQVLETLPVGTYTLSWKYTLTAIPSDTTTTLQVGKYIRVKYDGTYHILSSYSLTTIPTYAVGDSYNVQATITIDADAVGQQFEVLAYCGQSDAFYATLTEYQIEVGSRKTDFEPYVDVSNINVNAPITLEYIRSADTSPTRLTIGFNRDYTLNSFTSENSVDAYLHNSSTAHWDLYIGKSNSSDSVEILDFHNPWSNTDMTIDWDDTAVSTLPTGYISASKINGMMQCGVKIGSTVAANSYGDFAVTFPTPFPSIPTVCVSLYTSSTGYGMGSVSAVVCVGTISTTGFTIRCYNNDSEGRNPAYTWIAIL